MIILSNNKTVKKASEALAELLKKHPAWLLLLLIGLLTVYLFILFGLYALKNPDPQVEQTNNKIELEVYQKVLERLKNREAKIQQAKEASYPDIFR
jgi:hypothetical protein